MFQGCKFPLTQPTPISLGSNPDYPLKASNSLPSGFSLKLCYSCTIITPLGTLLSFTRDFIDIVQLKQGMIDCSMKEKFYPMISIKYNSKGSFVEYGKGYESFFIHSNKENCEVETCEMLNKVDKKCDSRLQTKDLKIS